MTDDADLARRNEWGQPVGPDLPGWTTRPAPADVDLRGTDVRLVSLTDDHVQGLFEATCGPDDLDRWTYIPAGPFRTSRELAAYVHRLQTRGRSHPLAILAADDERVLGTASYLNIEVTNGSVEVGSITYGRSLAGSRGSTEAMYLMMRHAFDDLGYRRYEWKCDNLNEPSKRAARRLGFVDEGVFRQHTVYKGRSRDTAWLAVIDRDWPTVRAALEAWLAPDNFDAGGRQRRRLGDLRAADS